MAWSAVVNGEQNFLVEVFDLTLADASVTRWTSYSQAITYSSNAYTAVPAIKRTAVPQSTDFGVGTVTLAVPVDDTYLDFDKVTNERLLEGATLKITQLSQKEFLSGGSYTNTRVIFQGEYAGHSNNVLVARIDFKDIFNMKRKILPKRNYTQSCPHQLTDSQCTLTLAGIKETPTVIAGSTTTVINLSASYAQHYFKGGYISFTSGTNDGEKHYIIASNTTTLTLLRPVAIAPVNGDTMDLYPHCRFTYDGCDALGNTLNFSGFQYIPMEEEIYSA